MTVSPPDAVVAARSFPRRWRALFAAATADEGGSDILQRSSAEQLAAQAATLLQTTADRVRPGLPSAGGGGGVLDRVEAAADHLARTIEAVPADEWEGEKADVLSAGIDQAAALLRQAEKAIEEAKARR
ncbi:MAG: hypothetical protein JWO68_736 [Actinomycetia bacterium]|nr:hypothetical protein [Actinomycetes bacterium]